MHDKYRLTTLPVDRRGHPRRRPGKPEPTPAAPLNSAPGENLSEKLNRSNGVIHPKEVDPTIEKPVPKTGDPNVVPPPGTSGGAPAPQAK
jgi:hypothetical protein